MWHFCGTRNSEKLEAVNKRILRFILNDYTYHYTTLLNKVEMTSLYNKRIQNFLILVYKSLSRRAGMRLKMARFLSAVFPISNFKMAALLSAWICI